MRRYENRSTMMTSNRPIEEWGKLLSDEPAAYSITLRLSPSPAAPTEFNQSQNEILSKVVLSGTGSASWYHLDNAVRRVFGPDDERFAKLA